MQELIKKLEQQEIESMVAQAYIEALHLTEKMFEARKQTMDLSIIPKPIVKINKRLIIGKALLLS